MADQLDASDNLLFLTGLYTRVARQLGVHPSYVSRVARGERRSDRVYRAIAAELSKLRGPSLAGVENDISLKASKVAATRDLRSKLVRRLTSDPRLKRMGVVICEEGDQPPVRAYRRKISPAALSAKVASNSRLIAGTVAGFEKLSSRLERFPHVLSLLDSDAVVLYSAGTTGMARREDRVPGTDWSKENYRISAAARCLAASAPIAIVGDLDLDGTFVPSVRFAVPVRLSDAVIAGVLVLSIEMTRARVDHLLELSRIAKRLCKFVENGPLDAPRKQKGTSRINVLREAAQTVAMVLSLPQVDPATRVKLSGLLAQLEAQGRQTLLESRKPRRSASARAVARAHGA